MTFTEQESILDRLNTDTLNVDYIIIDLSENVQFAQIWAGPNAGKSPTTRFNYEPSRYYLIKIDDQYCSIVLDAGSDLQVFTKLNHRGKNLLFKALNESILGHLKSSRSSQRVSTKIENDGAQKLLAKLGAEFIEQKQDKLFYKIDLVKKLEWTGNDELLSESEFNSMSRDCLNSFETLAFNKEKLDMTGNYIHLVDLLDDIKEMKSEFNNLLWEEEQRFKE